MHHQEKKFRVDSVAAFENKLKELGAKQKDPVTSLHFYAKQPGNDVTKLVVSSGKNEIHELEESHGKFSLKNRIPIKNNKPDCSG